MKDPYVLNYLLFFGALIISAFASWQVKSVYEKYSNKIGGAYTGGEIARYILEKNHIYDVQVVIGNTNNALTNFYDPKRKVVTLSENIYSSDSISAIAIAAHEVGHAIQHAVNYKGIVARNKILPAAIFSGNVSMALIMFSLIFNIQDLFYLGIGLYSIILIFQIVTLPVEFDASSRALKNLNEYALVDGEAHSGAKKVLNAAAFTYVAAVLSTVATIARLILINSGRRR